MHKFFLFFALLVLTSSCEKKKSSGSAEPKFLHFTAAPFEQLSDTIKRRYVLGEKAMVVLYEFSQGAEMPQHLHQSEMFEYVQSGRMQVTLGEKVYTLRAGDLLWIPPNMPHSVEVLEDSVVFDVFSPILSDWLKGEDSYLRIMHNKSYTEEAPPSN